VQDAHRRPDRERPARGCWRLSCYYCPASHAGPRKGRRLPQRADAARARSMGAAASAGHYASHVRLSRVSAFRHCVPPADMCRPATESQQQVFSARAWGTGVCVSITSRMHAARQARAGALGAGRVKVGPPEVEQQEEAGRERGHADQRPPHRLIRQHAHAQHGDEDAQHVTCTICMRTQLSKLTLGHALCDLLYKLSAWPGACVRATRRCGGSNNRRNVCWASAHPARPGMAASCGLCRRRLPRRPVRASPRPRWWRAAP